MNKHKPVIHIYQDGNQFFAALPDFIDLQESPVVWMSSGEMRIICQRLSSENKAKGELAHIAVALERLVEGE